MPFPPPLEMIRAIPSFRNLSSARLARLCAVLWAAVSGWFLFHVPFELRETTGNLTDFMTAPPAYRIFIDTFSRGAWPAPGFLRTFSLATSKLVFELSGGAYFDTYRALHVVMILFLMVMLVRLLRVESTVMLGIAALTLIAFVAMPTFHEAVRETELNIKLLIPVLCFAALGLSVSEPRRWHDVAAALLAFYAVFSNELGLLVCAGIVAAYIVGFRGVSLAGVLGVTLVLAGYFVLRFVVWDVGVPSLLERSSGFGFRILDPPELISRFGDARLTLYGYNIVSSVLTIFFAEPRSGVFVFVGGILDRAVDPSVALEVVTSTLSTGVMLWFAVRRWPDWRRWQLDYHDRLFLVSLAMIGGNAVISYPYLKEVVLSTAGIYYVLALACALRFVLEGWVGRTMPVRRAVVYFGFLAVLSLAWTVRGVGFFVDLGRTGSGLHREWRESPMASSAGRADPRMVAQLRERMMTIDVPSIGGLSPWLDALDKQH
jgi:hypothetical protein